MYINLTWNCRVCVGMAFICLLCAFLLSFTTLKWIGQQHFAKTNWDGVHFFTLKLGCHNSYNTVLCDSANGDIALCNKNNSEWVIMFFFEKRTKTCFFSKKPKKPEFEKNRRVGIFWKKRVSQPWPSLNPLLWFSLDRTIWNNWRHYQFDWVCAVHLG